MIYDGDDDEIMIIVNWIQHFNNYWSAIQVLLMPLAISITQADADAIYKS